MSNMPTEHTPFELEHFPHLCEIEHLIPTMPLDQLIQMIETDLRFINEIRLAFYHPSRFGNEFDLSKQNMSKIVRRLFANYAATTPDFVLYLFRTNAQSEALYPLRNIVKRPTNSIAAKIFRHYGNLNKDDKALWLRKFWHEDPGSFMGWECLLLRKDYSSKPHQKEKRHRNITLLCEVEGTADLIIDYICANYFPCHHGFKSTKAKKKTFNDEKDLSLATLVDIVIKWPKLAYKIINAMSKSPENKSALQVLTVELMRSVPENHANSILTLINLQFFEILFTTENSLGEVLALCDTFKIYGNSLLYFKQLKFMADVLSGVPLPQKHLDCSLEGLDERGPVTLRLEDADTLYRLVLSECNDEVMKAEILNRLNDPSYRFQLGEYFHRTGSYVKALEFYQNILDDGLNNTATLSTFVLSAGIPSNLTNQHLSQLRSRAVSVKKEGKEALLRIALLWVDRFNQLNLRPSSDAILLFEMAEKFICKGRFAEAHRLLALVPADSPLSQASQNKIQLLASHKKEWKHDTPLINRIDIIEFVLPHFVKASAADLEDATKAVGELTEELRLLQSNLPAGFNSTFTVNIGKLTQPDTESGVDSSADHLEEAARFDSLHQ